MRVPALILSPLAYFRKEASGYLLSYAVLLQTMLVAMQFFSSHDPGIWYGVDWF
jgi:hypothetical protein